MSFQESCTGKEKEEVWEKGIVDEGHDSSEWRKDACGAWIKRSDYGNRNSQFGWEIDYIDKNRENNSIGNLRPLQWKNNASGKCVVTATQQITSH
jgi:hypothetical protein